MSVVAVADTHAILWYLYNDPRLPIWVGEFIETANREKFRNAVSSITLVEIIYLVEKGKIPADAYSIVREAIDFRLFLEEAPVDRGVVDSLRWVSRDEIPDMPDRLIAATARRLQVPVISKDRKIQASNIETIW